MKKVININFQGRIIPIEETAYELLKQYIESLRRYFANEEGCEEIVNDIEGRIAELFSERLKRGITCITDADVNAVVADMGRPEDFEAQDAEASSATASSSTHTAEAQNMYKPQGRRPLYRNADDKVLGGVCSGLANYLNIDPVIMRIIFVLLLGALFWVYILLWIIVPSRSVESNITKRLYRNPDQKIIAGVAGGIASYFNIAVWVPRLIFALPFVLGLVSGTFHSLWWDWDLGFVPRMLSGSFGWIMFLTYVILWIAVPYATTSSERLEMRGEKVDLNSIRNTVKEDLENVRSKAGKLGTELKTSARQFSEQAAAGIKNIAADAGPVVRRSTQGLGYAIGIVIKAFLVFILVMVALALFSVFVVLVFGGFAFVPLKGFVLEGPVQNGLAWITLFLFFMLPLVGLITWGIRRIAGARSKKHYVGLTFLALWIIGLVCGIILVILIAGNFKSNTSLKEEQVLVSTKNKLFVDVEGAAWKKYNHQFLGIDIEGDDFPFYDLNEYSVFMNTVRLSMVKSPDSSFHVYRIRIKQKRNPEESNRFGGKDCFQFPSTTAR